MDRTLQRALRVFLIVGLLVSIYMTLYKMLNNDAFCLGSGDCATVIGQMRPCSSWCSSATHASSRPTPMP